MKSKKIVNLLVVCTMIPLVLSGTGCIFGSAKDEEAAKIFKEALSENPTQVSVDVLDNSVSGVLGLYAEQLGHKAGMDPGNILGGVNMSFLQAAWFGTITRMISTSSIFGGDQTPGFTPKIRNAFIHALLETRVSLTPDGVLIVPTSQHIQVRAYSKKLRECGYTANAALIVTNEKGELLTDGLQPLKKSFMNKRHRNEDGTFEIQKEPIVIDVEKLETELGLDKLPNLRISYNNNDSAMSSTIDAEDDVDYDILGCLRLVASGDLAGAGKCLGAVGTDFANFLVTALKEGVVGAGAGALVGEGMGIGLEQGAIAGGFLNILVTGYNTFLKKETLSKREIKSILNYFNAYSISPRNGKLEAPNLSQWYVEASHPLKDKSGQVVMKDGKVIMTDTLIRLVKPTTLDLENDCRDVTCRGSVQIKNGTCTLSPEALNSLVHFRPVTAVVTQEAVNAEKQKEAEQKQAATQEEQKQNRR